MCTYTKMLLNYRYREKHFNVTKIHTLFLFLHKNWLLFFNNDRNDLLIEANYFILICFLKYIIIVFDFKVVFFSYSATFFSQHSCYQLRLDWKDSFGLKLLNEAKAFIINSQFSTDGKKLFPFFTMKMGVLKLHLSSI